jgi:ferredoxin-NADP reductase
MGYMDETERLLVRTMHWEADGVLTVTFARKDGGELPEWEPGSHVDLVLDNGLIRQYSLCGDPSDRDEYVIGVLHRSGGSGGSRFVHEELRPGMFVSVAPPRNNFPLAEAPDYLFVAGGIGVTPLLPMVRRLARDGADWKLLYGGRSRASMAFLGLGEELGDSVRISPDDEAGALPLNDFLSQATVETAVYCCGPEPLIDAVVSWCASAGLPRPHIERFEKRHVEADPGAQQNESFDVVLAVSGKQYQVPPDRSIIEVLEENGEFVPTSCREGYCGVCETVVVEGVPEHRDEYLTPEQRELNKTMMICCGRSKGPKLVLEL